MFDVDGDVHVHEDVDVDADVDADVAANKTERVFVVLTKLFNR